MNADMALPTKVFGERVRYARELRGLTQQELADITGEGCSQGNINSIENRKSTQSKYARALAMALEVRLDWLLYGKGEMAADDKTTITQVIDTNEYFEGADNVYVNHYQAQTGRKLMMRKTIFSELDIDPNSVKYGNISGDSMSPVINDCAEIAFDTSKTEIKNGRIYALQAGEKLYCAYLQVKPSAQGEQIRLFHANSDYPDEVMMSEQFFATYQVLGYVFWWSNIQSW